LNVIFPHLCGNEFAELAGLSVHLDKIIALKSLGAVKIQNGKTYFTNAGTLLFAHKVRDIHPHIYVNCVAFRTDERVDILDSKIFDNSILENLNQSLNFISRHINVSTKITGRKSESIWEVPEIALREALINALIHRDYLETGAQVCVEIFPSKIRITNPGGLPKGLPKKEFGKQSLARNAVLAGIIQRTPFMEKLGTGISRINRELRAANIRDANFIFNRFFIVEFERARSKNKITKKSSQKSSQKILDEMKVNQEVTIEELSKIIGISDRAVKAHISKLKEKGMISRIGPDKGGYWKVSKHV
jgi:ATP-dependent DNA helicase RecG